MGKGETASTTIPRRQLSVPMGPMYILVKCLCPLYTVHSSSAERYVLKESTWLKLQLVIW